MVVFVNISLCDVRRLLDFLGVRGEVRRGEIVGYFLLITEATLGGAALVWVRMRLPEMHKQ